MAVIATKNQEIAALTAKLGQAKAKAGEIVAL